VALGRDSTTIGGRIRLTRQLIIELAQRGRVAELGVRSFVVGRSDRRDEQMNVATVAARTLRVPK
jgi:hypothetical protein